MVTAYCNILGQKDGHISGDFTVFCKNKFNSRYNLCVIKLYNIQSLLEHTIYNRFTLDLQVILNNINFSNEKYFLSISNKKNRNHELIKNCFQNTLYYILVICNETKTVLCLIILIREIRKIFLYLVIKRIQFSTTLST